jgi:chitin disaccharide deacetylase
VKRILIVNADDFGRSPGINQGSARAHERGIVTSASLMVRYPAALDAAAYARAHADLSVGLHLDGGEWIYRDGGWAAVYEIEPLLDEVEGQLEQFRRLVGEDPTHLDSHQHIHRDEPLKTQMVELADRLGVPVRHFSPSVRYVGDFFGQDHYGAPLPGAIGVDNLVALICDLEAGVTELGCHPGEGDDLESSYVAERPIEVETLCDSRVRQALDRQGVELRSFSSAFA